MYKQEKRYAPIMLCWDITTCVFNKAHISVYRYSDGFQAFWWCKL